MSLFEYNEQALAAVFSVAGPGLSASERDLFKSASPLGFILFARNCETPDQLADLVRDLKGSVGYDCPILIDQEGGRVQRLKPPIWKGFPSAQYFGARYESDPADALSDLDLAIRQMSAELRAAGVNVNCAPVLDVLSETTHESIGDRAFSEDPDIVCQLGQAAIKAFMASGIVPVIKHLPGQGRAASDSHTDLPVVAAEKAEMAGSDFRPFKKLAQSEFGASLWGMVAHVIYSNIDSDHPASVSPDVISELIRGDIGFDGALLSDDLDMGALSRFGTIPDRAVASLEAGCDVALYCSGRIGDMEDLASRLPQIGAATRKRLQNSAESAKLAA